MAKPRSKPQLSLFSAPVYDDAAGIGEDHWCRWFFRMIRCAFDDGEFADLYEEGGRSPISPGLLACIMILQYCYRVSDRMAVHATVFWRDWRIALGLPLDYEGFCPTVLTRFRQRLMRAGAQERIFGRVLARCAEQQLPELWNAPEFMALYERYGVECWLGGRGSSPTRLVELGRDGYRLLAILGDREVRGKATLAQALAENFIVEGDDDLRPREGDELPSDRIMTPHDRDARYGKKGDRIWQGRKVHVTETVSEAGANRIEADVVWGGTNGAVSIGTGRVSGFGVKVAVIDTGIDGAHPDLAANYKGGVNCITAGGSPADDNGHGTHVAGIVAAVDNGIGVIETAPRASLYAVKVLDSSGSGWYSDIIEGVQWAADNAMHVASMSLGGTSDSVSLKSACDAAYAKNVLLVAAAGNNGAGADTVLYPAKYDSVIAVAATDSSNNRASFSSTGPTVELAAPGVSIKSTLLGGGYGAKSGTSMACPHVSGVAALVIEGGVTSASAVRERLQSTATDLGAAGRDTYYGYGLVNANAAVQTGPTDNPPTVAVTTPAAGQSVSGAVTLTANAADDKGVTQVEFRIDGVTVGADTNGSDGWSCRWDSAGVSDGAHTAQAIATDTIGQTGSGSNGFTAQNSAGGGTGAIAGKVTDAKTRKAIAGATVTAVSASGASFSATTANHGQYTIGSVPVGTYSVTAGAEGSGPARSWQVAGRQPHLSVR